MSWMEDSSPSASIEMNEVDELPIDELAPERVSLIDWDGEEAIGKKIAEGAKKIESMSSACIYRVPAKLRKLNESAYTPRLVSIGPLHCSNKHLLKLPMQNVKMSYVNSLFSRMERVGISNSEMLKECVDEMRHLKEKAKRCYAEEVEGLNEGMLVIDGCFILELLYRDKHGEKKTRDPIFDSVLMRNNIIYDLLLLENQLPFFVLNKLFDLTVARIQCVNLTLTGYVTSYFEEEWNSGEKRITATPKNDYCHILDILHNQYRPQDAVPGDFDDDLDVFMPCASDLEYAGIKFQAGQKVWFSEPKGSFPSRLFNRAHFEIPTLRIYDNTELFLRNLIAFEQCCPGVPRYFTSYAYLMDTLVNTPKDVQVLEKAKIIRNYLGSDEDATVLFNTLCKEVIYGESYFAKTRNDAANYSKHWLSDAMAHLRRKYFASPWTFIAFCAGAVTFIISLINFGIALSKFIRANNFR